MCRINAGRTFIIASLALLWTPGYKVTALFQSKTSEPRPELITAPGIINNNNYNTYSIV